MLFLGLGLFLVWWSLRGISAADRQQIINTFAAGNYGWLVVSGAFAVLSNISRAMRWQMLIEPVAQRPRFMNTFFAVMIGYLANLAFPRLGEVARCGTLQRYEGIAPTVAFGTVITERIIDLLSLVLLVVLLVCSQFNIIGHYFVANIGQPLWHKLAALVQQPMWLLVMAAALAAGWWLWQQLAAQIQHHIIYQKIKQAITTMWAGIQSVRQVRNVPLFVAHSVFIWCMYLLMCYVCFFTTNVTAHLGLGVALSVLVFGTFGMIATQGGVGAYPLIVAALLQLYGISYQLGLGFGWIIWGLQTGMMMLGGFVSLVALPLYNRRLS